VSKSHTSPSLAILLQRFFVDYLQSHRSLSPCTIAAYRDTFKLLLRFAERHLGKSPVDLALADIDTGLVLSFLDHLEQERHNATRSRNARLAALRSFLKFAAHHDLIALPVIEQALAVPMKRFERPMLGFLSREEIAAVLNAPEPCGWTGQRDRALLAALYNTGARVSEVIGIRLKDVVLVHSPCVHLHGKGRKNRTVPLWRSTAELIRKWKRCLHSTEETSYLFPNRGGSQMTRSNVAQRLALAVSAATTKCSSLKRRAISPHTIRHATAMHLLQSGVDISVIAVWLGHESPATTHMYVEADLTMKQRALGRLQPTKTSSVRYKPPDKLMSFLESL
jgi:site-specific recombinase XerD